MENTLILGILAFLVIMMGVMGFFMYRINAHMHEITHTMKHHYNMTAKLQATLQNKSATNAVTENAELIYQDLLQKIIPIMAAIDVMPRATNEHPLWRALGGLLDEYSKNPFVLENLRRRIKLDSDVARNIDGFMTRADAFLNHLGTNDTNGMLTETFTDGLLGQSLTFFAQAKQLATQNME